MVVPAALDRFPGKSLIQSRDANEPIHDGAKRRCFTEPHSEQGCYEVQVKHAGKAPVKRANDHQAGCKYIKVFHNWKVILSLRVGMLRQPQFDLKEKLFYCEEQGEDVFPLRKESCRKQQLHENDLEYGD
jgi:hypothetical protein